jgi:hypothetical protein
MILEALNQEIYISFDFNRQEKTIKLGEVLEIYLDNMLNEDLKITYLTKINSNLYTFTAVEVGEFEISVDNSNILTIKVIE